MKQLIPTPIQRVGYTSLITSNIAITRQVLGKKLGFIRLMNLKQPLNMNECYQHLKTKECQAL